MVNTASFGLVYCGNCLVMPWPPVIGGLCVKVAFIFPK